MIKFFLLLSLFCSQAWSFVQVNPTRFLIKDVKFGHFTVRNTQSKPVIVEIDSKYFAQASDGKMSPDNTKATDELKKILFTPKNFTLGPGEKQVVRFFVKDNLATAELRTFAHILTEIKTEQATSESSAGAAMSLTPKVAVAIPMVHRLRTDKENISFTGEKLAQKDEDCILSAQWNNKTHSSFINLEALDDDDKVVYQMNGASNYLKEYAWNAVLQKIKCSAIKKIKVYDVDNEVYVVSREIKQ